MIIRDLYQMEKIVSYNKKLSWDGWNVVELIHSDKGRLSPIGAFIKGQWYIKKVFSPSRDGWDIPKKYVG